jgi:choline dehydrogenase-like flavoprotein
MLPTSRGTIALRDSEASSDPAIDPNYMATEVDRHVMREGLRKIWRVLRDTPSGLENIAGETVEEDGRPISEGHDR